jgi:catecholate siderophore receptor
VNVENATNALFWPTAHNDNNITPAAPANVRVTLGFSF